MTGYHLTAKAVSFGRGQSAVHTAAYNARTQLHHEREDRLTKDYSTRDATLFTGIFAPAGAPAWTQDREQLWNRAEAAERQANGQPARSMIVAFPHELDQQQREFLIKDFAREQFARKGMIADVAMHAPDREGDQRNYHAHILLTMRKLDGPEFAKTKCREWNSKEQLTTWREAWAERSAKALERAGHPVEAERWRHGHQTLGEQRAAAVKRGDLGFAESLDREPGLHKGARATAMDRQGVPSERMDRLKQIVERNDIRIEMKAIDGQLAALEREEREQRQRGGSPAPGLEWTDRAGMVAQEASAMRWASSVAAERGQRPGGDPGAGKPRSFEDRDHDPAPAADRQVADRRQRFFEDRRPTGDALPARQPGGPAVRVVDHATGKVSTLADFARAMPVGAPAWSARSSPAPARLADMRQAEAADQALDRIRQDMAAGRDLKSGDITSLTRRQRDVIRAKGEDGLRQLVDDFQKRKDRDHDRDR